MRDHPKVQIPKKGHCSGFDFTAQFRMKVVGGVVGNGLISAVARCDLAAVAAKVLADPIPHHNQIYELSGDRAFSLQELAENLGLEYAPTSLEAERSRLENLSLLPFQAPMLMSIFAAGSAGFLETGATDLKRFIEDPENALKTAVAAASG